MLNLVNNYFASRKVFFKVNDRNFYVNLNRCVNLNRIVNLNNLLTLTDSTFLLTIFVRVNRISIFVNHIRLPYRIEKTKNFLRKISRARFPTKMALILKKRAATKMASIHSKNGPRP